MERDGSIFAGAIFMSNRETKLECLRRKLFGLPYSKAKFLKQVKAGMILFLFEHEERKLYGLFEATSDGALNIIPGAFKSTGQSYPAQILFKRIWMCRPLCEDEFRSAIGENYYSPNKFHFGLSFGQVKSLIHLFYSKKINLKQDPRPALPKTIERFEYSAADNTRSSEKGSSAKCESDEHSRDRSWQVRRQTSHSNDAQIYHPSHPCSETVNSQHSSVYRPDFHDTFELSATAEMVPGQSARFIINLDDDMTVPYNPDAPAFKLPCNNAIARTALKPLDVVNEVYPQTSLLRRNSDYVEFPDYIPLPEEPPPSFGEGNYEYVSSTELGSCIPSMAVAYEDEMNVADDFPKSFTDGRLHSDSESGRASVFSRLSRDQDARDHGSAESSTELTLEQLFGKLAEKREAWSTARVPQQLREWFNNVQNECSVSTESFRLIEDQSVEWSDDGYRYKDGAETESAGAIAPFEYDQSIEDASEASFELPFYNFRRRNASLKRKAQDDPSPCNEKTDAKSKRRRILRPSLNEGNTTGEAEAKMPAKTISEYENQNQAKCRDAETEDEESFEVAHPAPVFETEDYIPLD